MLGSDIAIHTHTTLLFPINLGIACLVDDKLAHAHPTPDQAEAYAQARKKAITAQQDYALAQDEEKAKLMKEKYKHQIEKRQKEKLAKKEQEQRIANSEQASSDIQGILPAEEPVVDIPVVAEAKDSAITKDSSHVPYSIITPTSSDGRPWYKPDPLTSEVDAYQSKLSISSQTFPMARSKFFFLDANNHFMESTISPEEAALNDITKKGQVNNGTNWSDGSGVTASSSGDSEMQELKKARIEVFRDLWKNGYFMGSGLKFGADFLVYPGKFRPFGPIQCRPSVLHLPGAFRLSNAIITYIQATHSASIRISYAQSFHHRYRISLLSTSWHGVD